MSDIPPTDDTTIPPPPPPPGAEPVDPPFSEGLRRSRSDRVVAGVAGGLGHHFGIDPVIIRIGFVLLTIFGGSGILLYLLAWLVIAKEGNQDTSAMRALRGSPEGNRALLFVVLAVGAVLILFSPLVWFDGFGIGDGLALPLLLIAAGVAFLIWPGDDDSRRRAAPAPPQPYAPPPPAPPEEATGTDDAAAETAEPLSTESEIRAELRAAGDEVRSELAEARDSFRQQSQEWRHGYRARRHANRTPRPPRPPKPAPFLGPLTVAVLLVFAGVSMVGEQSDWWDADPAVYGGITLAIIGAGLVASAFFGRARGLIFLGIAVLPFAWAIAAVDLDWHDGIGEETDTVNSLADLEDSYTFGVGDYEVDLSAVDLGGAERDVEVGLTIGELTVWVPDTLQVVIDADTRLGEIEVFGTTDVGVLYDDEFEAEIDTTFGDADGGTLNLDIDLGIGSLDIRTCSPNADVDAQIAGGLVPCP